MTSEEMYNKNKNKILYTHSDGGRIRIGEVVGYLNKPNICEILMAVNEESEVSGWFTYFSDFCVTPDDVIFKRLDNPKGYWHVNESSIIKVINPFKFGK